MHVKHTGWTVISCFFIIITAFSCNRSNMVADHPAGPSSAGTNPSTKTDSGIENGARMSSTELENYRLRVRESEKLWKPRQNISRLDTIWFYGYYGGANYNAGTFPDRIVLDDLSLFQSVKSLNTVDEAFKRHDWNSIDKKNRRFYDRNDKTALIAHYALALDLQDIIKNGIVRDTVSGMPLPEKENRDALNAARQAKWGFRTTVDKAEKSLIQKQHWTKKQLLAWKNSDSVQKDISDARNAALGSGDPPASDR